MSAILHLQRSAEAVANLKSDWLSDPCWDIENTEGFEAHKEELLRSRLVQEQKWEERRAAELKAYADKLGLSDNLKLAEYIRALEFRKTGSMLSLNAELRQALKEYDKAATALTDQQLIENQPLMSAIVEGRAVLDRAEKAVRP